MRICLFSPYLPKHTGGGERYLFDVARCLRPRHDVEIALAGQDWDEAEVRKRYEQFLGYSLDGVSFRSSPLFTSAGWWRKLWWSRQFDVMYYLTDGSLFMSLAERNVLHIQFPLQLDKSGWRERLKLKNWHVKNTNSEFTKRVVSTTWPVKIDYVHPPAIELPQEPPGRKKNIILHVGRFFRHLHTKRQDVLVEIWRQLVTDHPQVADGWKLVLVGAVEDHDYAQEVAEQSRELPVEIHHQVDRAALEAWYRRARIYWHATGYGVDETAHPEKVEHFGITTLEAMAHGCVPVVINKGGQREIMTGQLGRLLWTDRQQAIDTTLEVMTNPKVADELAAQVRHRAAAYSLERFSQTLSVMVEGQGG